MCGMEKREMVGHAWQEATCTMPKRCAVCTLTVDSALGHDYQGTRACVRCGEDNPEYIQQFSFKLNSDSSGYVLLGCGNYKGEEVTIPATFNGKPVMGIYQGAFKNMTNVTTVTMGENVQSIGPSVFEGCTNLKTVNMPQTSKLRTIYKRAFALCKNLEEITLPDTVTSLGFEVFAECSSLKRVTIGKGVVSIAEDTFRSCILLETVEFNGTTQQWSQNFNKRVNFLPYSIKEIQCLDGVLEL